jgi:hypothetical protein
MSRRGPLGRGLLCAIFVALGGCALHRQRPPTELPQIRVQDLHYGDVMFHVYGGEQFAALTRLEAYQQWGRMPHNEHDALMQAGSLYLQLGMHNEAAARFERLLTPDVPAPIRDRAWYYLAKVWYQRGYYDRSSARGDSRRPRRVCTPGRGHPTGWLMRASIWASRWYGRTASPRPRRC